MERDFAFEVKSIDDAGVFTGLASTYGNTDQQNEAVMPGAFTKTLLHSKERPLLWQHSPHEPIGTVSLSDSPSGLIARGKLSLDIPQAKNAYTLLRDGVINAMSIGFQTIKSDVKSGIRQLTELKLFEVSLVTFPANERALVTSVKSLNDNEKLQIAASKFSQEFLRVLRKNNQWI
jgi:HK97 family phage prohead protease